MAAQEDAEPTSYHEHTKSTATYKSFPSENQMNCSAQQKIKGAHLFRQQRQRLSLTKVKPVPQAPTLKREGSHQAGTSGGARDWCPTSGTLAPGICTGEQNPQNAWVGNPKEQMSRGPKVLLETEIPLLEGSCVVLLARHVSNEKTAE